MKKGLFSFTLLLCFLILLSIGAIIIFKENPLFENISIGIFSGLLSSAVISYIFNRLLNNQTENRLNQNKDVIIIKFKEIYKDMIYSLNELTYEIDYNNFFHLYNYEKFDLFRKYLNNNLAIEKNVFFDYYSFSLISAMEMLDNYYHNMDTNEEYDLKKKMNRLKNFIHTNSKINIIIYSFSIFIKIFKQLNVDINDILEYEESLENFYQDKYYNDVVSKSEEYIEEQLENNRVQMEYYEEHPEELKKLMEYPVHKSVDDLIIDAINSDDFGGFGSSSLESLLERFNDGYSKAVLDHLCKEDIQQKINQNKKIKKIINKFFGRNYLQKYKKEKQRN